MFCQPLDKIIVSDFVTFLMKVQIKTKNAGPGLADFLICKPDTLPVKEMNFVWQDLFLVNQC